MMALRGSRRWLPRPLNRSMFVSQLIVLVLLLPPIEHAVGETDRAPQHVLMISMSNVVLPASEVSTQKFLSTLEAEVGAPLIVRQENLEAIENLRLDAVEEAREAARLSEKYADERLDLIIARGSVALEFALRHRIAIAPAAPIVYFSVANRRLNSSALPRDVGGVSFDWDLAGTLELALHLQPQAREVFYIAGVAPYDQVFESVFDEAVAPYSQRLRVTKLIGHSLEDLQIQVASIPRDSIVLYASMWRDAAGVVHKPSDVLGRLSEISAAPIYGVFSSLLGRGALGGSVVDFEAQGREAGKYAASVLERLRRSQPLSLDHRVLRPACLIDERQLDKWDVEQGRVPGRCKVLHGAAPLVLSSRATLIASGAALVLIASMLAAVLVQRRRRRMAEQAAAHAARLAVIGEISASIMHEVAQPMSAILSNADAAEMLLGHKEPSVDKVLEVLADIRRDNARAHQIVMQLKSLLRKGELHIQQLDLNELTSSAVVLIRSEATRRQTVIEHRPEPNLPPIAGDAVHLQQVILNVMVNALDAMEAIPAQHRRLRISTALEGDASVSLRVRDSGLGISPAQLPKLFQSFYTTKRDGMGLGLSIAKTIIDAHRGVIRAVNSEEGGAEFHITLPIYNSLAAAALGRAYPEVQSRAG